MEKLTRRSFFQSVGAAAIGAGITTVLPVIGELPKPSRSAQCRPQFREWSNGPPLFTSQAVWAVRLPQSAEEYKLYESGDWPLEYLTDAEMDAALRRARACTDHYTT